MSLSGMDPVTVIIGLDPIISITGIPRSASAAADKLGNDMGKESRGMTVHGNASLRNPLVPCFS